VTWFSVYIEKTFDMFFTAFHCRFNRIIGVAEQYHPDTTESYNSGIVRMSSSFLLDKRRGMIPDYGTQFS